MIVDLPDTTTREVNRTLVRIREEGGAITLGRVLTLVIDADGGDPEEAIEAANDASREHPCRVIVLVPNTRRRTSRLDAEIRVGGDAGASEVVVLRPSGQLAHHGDTLVTPLLLSDAPIVTWWPYEVPKDPAQDCIGAMSARRITDTTHCANPDAALRRLRATHVPGDTDLAWTRLTRWRGLLAAALDQPPYEPVDAVVVAGEKTHPSLNLLAGWLALALRAPVRVVRELGVEGITEVRLERASGPVVLSRPDGKRATLDQPGQPSRKFAMPLRSLRECLSEELRRLDADEVYGEVLTKGLALIDQG